MFILIFLIAWKEGLQTWVLSKLQRNKEEVEESLTSGRGEPDFWIIGNELERSRREHLTPIQQQRIKQLAIENMTNEEKIKRKGGRRNKK